MNDLVSVRVSGHVGRHILVVAAELAKEAVRQNSSGIDVFRTLDLGSIRKLNMVVIEGDRSSPTVFRPPWSR